MAYKLCSVPDDYAVLSNGTEVTPLATLTDEHGGVSHIIMDGGCYVLCNGTEHMVSLVTHWHEEATQALWGILEEKRLEKLHVPRPPPPIDDEGTGKAAPAPSWPMIMPPVSPQVHYATQMPPDLVVLCPAVHSSELLINWTHEKAHVTCTQCRGIIAIVNAIRADPLVGSGTCASINEAYDDEELWALLSGAWEVDDTTEVADAVKIARDLEELWIENATNYRWGEDTDPQLVISKEWKTAREAQEREENVH